MIVLVATGMRSHGRRSLLLIRPAAGKPWQVPTLQCGPNGSHCTIRDYLRSYAPGYRALHEASAVECTQGQERAWYTLPVEKVRENRRVTEGPLDVRLVDLDLVVSLTRDQLTRDVVAHLLLKDKK
jgi:hypothetical protein